MSTTAIRVENLAKRYFITAGDRARYATFRDVLGNFLRGRWGNRSGRRVEELWALRDVNFQVEEGERLGIIGMNGAGKTTLLKILSRVTAPTKGRVVMRGRVSSLLEVGTGFHPELTGRENIFFNGALLGMTKREIVKKFDEIVSFAEVEKFIDEPLKRYSSGMSLRLAFSVAAHLDADILLLDEVLAVGDARFQEKCLGKMKEVARQGKTVLFVSHNLAAVESTCTKAMIIREGINSTPASPGEVVEEYLKEVRDVVEVPLAERRDRTGRGRIRMREIRVRGGNGKGRLGIGEDVEIEVDLENGYDDDVHVRLSLSVRTSGGEKLISCDSLQKGKSYCLPGKAKTTVLCRILSPPLNVGEYFVNVAVYRGEEAEDWVTNAARFTVESGSFRDFTHYLDFPILADFDWEVISHSR